MVWDFSCDEEDDSGGMAWDPVSFNLPTSYKRWDDDDR